MSEVLNIQPGNLVGAYRMEELLHSQDSQRLLFRGRRVWAIEGGPYSKLGLGFGGEQSAGEEWLVEACLPGIEASRSETALERLRKLNRSDIAADARIETVPLEGFPDGVRLMAQRLSPDVHSTLSVSETRTALREAGAALAAAHHAGIVWGCIDRWHLVLRDGRWQLLPTLATRAYKLNSAGLKKPQSADVISLIKCLDGLTNDARFKAALNRLLPAECELPPTAAEVAVAFEPLPPVPPALEFGGECAEGHLLQWEADFETQVRLLDNAPAWQHPFLTEELDRCTQMLGSESPLQVTPPPKTVWPLVLACIRGEVARLGPVHDITWLPDVTGFRAVRDGSFIQLYWRWAPGVSAVAVTGNSEHPPVSASDGNMKVFHLHDAEAGNPACFEIGLGQGSRLFFCAYSLASKIGGTWWFSPGKSPGCRAEVSLDELCLP